MNLLGREPFIPLLNASLCIHTYSNNISQETAVINCGRVAVHKKLQRALLQIPTSLFCMHNLQCARPRMPISTRIVTIL